MKLNKKQKEIKKELDETSIFNLSEAFPIAKKFSSKKFDESVDVSVVLGIDAKKSDQMVRGAVSLPNGTGKAVRILVFAKGELEEEARAAAAAHAAAAAPPRWLP